MSSPLQLRFLTSADDVSRLPDTPAELAFIGRSNVGKSSLVNALGNRKDLARVAKAPGRTQLLNCFAVDGLGTLVDCPGYGYAAAPARVRDAWQRMVETYLLEREQLTMVVMLVDGEIGPTKLDLQMLAWLRANAVPHSVVATKHDKLKAAQRGKRQRDLAAACDLAPDDVTWVSAAKGTGKDRLLSLVRTWLALG
ncbi:MAG: YihA family ribosome biogenesis GTP-binding protein [Actinobacteria bacterium]|nr:MAG: YihA family ribosome biogenesis GTP-binding protein [Actinomycetota bacterium]